MARWSGALTEDAYIFANKPPVAGAGPDQFVTVAPGDIVMETLDGSGSSDPNGDPLSYTWTDSFGTAMGVMPPLPLRADVQRDWDRPSPKASLG